MKKEFHLIIDGQMKIVPQGTTYEMVLEEYRGEFDAPVVLAKFNGRLRELFKKITMDGELSFVTLREKPGLMTYRRSAILLMQRALISVLKDNNTCVHVLFTMDNAFYCELFSNNRKVDADEEFIHNLEGRMRQLVELDVPIMKRPVHVETAKAIFGQNGFPDKQRLFEYRRVSNVNLYNLDGYEDYFYGYMLPRTGLIDKFELKYYDGGFFLNLPSASEPNKVDPMELRPKLFGKLHEACVWAHKMNMATVGELNDVIVAGDMQSMIMAQDAVQEHHIAEIARQIAADPKKKFVLIAGPSASGKTTFSHRLSTQLYAHGLHPHPIGLDDFFIDRDKMTPQPDGTLDFEAIEVVDIEFFNDVCERLLAGEEVSMPTFNFVEGRREFRGNKLKIEKDDILVIEGIHGLNPKISYRLPDENKFKVYISALTPLKIDEHNCISTRDCRLIRRMIRDNRTRGNNALVTMQHWQSVGRGEEKHIFPFQENADAMFNSALIYELSILKPYVEPLLFAVPKDAPEYIEAKRLLKFLDFCLPYSSELLTKQSILREFIGGSCYNV